MRTKNYIVVLATLLTATLVQARSNEVLETSQESESTLHSADDAIYVVKDGKLLEKDTVPFFWKDTVGVHPWDSQENEMHYVRENLSHWSMYLSAGFNVFDGDFTSEKKHAVWVPTVGLGGVYHWNNTWGIGAEYKFRRYRVTGVGGDVGADVMLDGRSHQAGAYLAFDIFNAFRPQNKSKLFALDLMLGGGALWYKNSKFYSNTYRKWDSDFPYTMDTHHREPESQGRFKATGFFMAGVSAEFNLNRSFQLGLRGVYQYSTTDQWDGRSRSNNNDGAFDCEVILRYKFEPRNKSNVRNSMVKTVENWNGGIYYIDPNIGKEKRKRKATDHVVDTLYIVHKDTIYINDQVKTDTASSPAVVCVTGGHVETININSSSVPVVTTRTEEQAPSLSSIKRIRDYVVFFNNDDAELDNLALTTITEAANELKENPTYQVVVVGSCDNTGAVEYNKWLAVQRATNVTNMLVDAYGIDSDRIYFIGRGIMQDDREEGSYRANRRVEIHLVNQEEMDKAKRMFKRFESNKWVKKGSAVRQKGEGANASSSKVMEDSNNEEPSQPTAKLSNKKQDESLQGSNTQTSTNVLDVVTVTTNMTLSQLSRKYYGNARYWTIIYEANKDKLVSPDVLDLGVRLVIPKREA